jgi:hypothetical protein
VANETLSEHLDSGRIDALISALAPSCFGRNPTVQRLFPDYRAAEEAYFRRTRMFPIMHLVGIRRSLVERHPWLAVNTYVAYLKAKELCYRHMETIGHLFTTLPWPVEEFQRAWARISGATGSSRTAASFPPLPGMRTSKGLTSGRSPRRNCSRHRPCHWRRFDGTGAFDERRTLADVRR